MDNASKALLMAGAVLVAVLTVSVMVYFMNQGKVVNGDNIKNLDAKTAGYFNSIFTPFVGDSESSTACQQLINKIDDCNKKYDYSHVTTDPKKITIKNNATYKIEIEKYDSSGLISVIKISEN